LLNGSDLESTSQKIYNPNDPILFDNLTKKFGSFTAVNSLKMSIREGEVFTILGHNGAGKTTAIYMLTGMYNASGGNASVYGYNIRDNIDQV
jgi:ABC-type multidrug transport system ATPase subunit